MKTLKNPVYLAIIIGMTLAFLFQLSTFSQNVKRIGNTFVEQCDSSKTKRSEAKKINMTYIDKDGKSYDIYLSSNNRAFIKKVSKKTGKEYRKYLPEVTKHLGYGK